MKSTILLIKNISLFVFGIFLIIWGYKVNESEENKNTKTNTEIIIEDDKPEEASSSK